MKNLKKSICDWLMFNILGVISLIIVIIVSIYGLIHIGTTPRTILLSIISIASIVISIIMEDSFTQLTIVAIPRCIGFITAGLIFY